MKPTILSGNHLILEPFSECHREPLKKAANDERIWTYNSIKAFGHKFDSWFDAAIKNMASGSQLPYAVRRIKDNAIVGSSRFYDISHEHHRLTIGFTWYILDVWGTVVNPECKFLMLQYAFEKNNVNRVEFVTDVRNARSRAAIKKLGAAEEGILRNHMVLEDGYIRDTTVYSIIEHEWPNVRLALSRRLDNDR